MRIRSALLLAVAFAGLLARPGSARARERGDGWSAVRAEIEALRRLTPAERAGRRFLLVVDVDYTVTDPRRRTQRAAELFGLGRVPLRRVGWDGLETARNLGLDAKTAARFQRFWRTFFWDPRNLRLDQALPSAAILHEAKAAGAEIVYLTGRTDPLRDATRARLQKLGFPDADQVVTKPRVSVRTTAFKTRWLGALPKGTHVLAYMTDSPGELRSLRRGGVKVPTIYVHGPSPEARGVTPKAPTILFNRFPRR